MRRSPLLFMRVNEEFTLGLIESLPMRILSKGLLVNIKSPAVRISTHSHLLHRDLIIVPIDQNFVQGIVGNH